MRVGGTVPAAIHAVAAYAEKMSIGATYRVVSEREREVIVEGRYRGEEPSVGVRPRVPPLC